MKGMGATMNRRHKTFRMASGIVMAVTILCAAGAGAGADVSVREALTAWQANQPDVVFGMLPQSYQQDLEAIVTGFANRMDTELWHKGRGLLAKLAAVGSDQRALLVQFAVQQQGEQANAETVGQGLDAGTALIRQLAASPLLDLERLGQGRLKALLAETGPVLMETSGQLAQSGLADDAQNPWELARAIDQVTLVSAEGDHATVSIDPDEPPQAFVRVEGAWIPAEMAEGWDDWRRETMQSVAALDFTSPEGQRKKSQAMMMMSMLDGVLDQASRAQSVEELQAGLMGLMMMGGGMMMQQPPAP